MNYNGKCLQFDIIPIGGAIFPTMSFFNHSCYPNAMRLGFQNQQVVRVIRNIPAGAEVNIDYGFDFYATPMEYRHKRALANYHFKCDCMACTNRWPVYDRLVDNPPQYRYTSIVKTLNGFRIRFVFPKKSDPVLA